MQFTIEKNITIPHAAGCGRPPKYPLKFMIVGDSFAFEREHLSNITQAAYKVRNKFNFKFVFRKVDGGFRVWRIA